tara:strand:- start:235 stop:1140 length:906 start_codon:yes stop_codon:yes gene_type:complete
MTINTSQIQQLLRPGLAEVFGDYPMYPAEYTSIFETKSSDKAVEIEVEMKMLGLASQKGEGAPTAFQDMGQRVVSTYYHRYTSVGFIITRQAMKDNLYESQFPQQSTSLRNSMMQSKEVNGAAVLNNGFNAAFPGGDGVSLFSTAHPIDTGTFANTPAVQTDLNEAALQSAITAISQFRDQAGLICMTKPECLIVPPQLQFTADRLLHSEFRTGTANNDINAIYNMAAVPNGYKVNHFLTDTNAWFLKTNADNGLKHYVREKLETDVFTDFTTDNLLAKAIERYSFGWSNSRAMFASSGAT